MRALSLFSGIGGIDLAGEWAGIKTVAMCEREPFCQKVLRKHWPDVPIYDDVKTLTKERLEADGIGTIDLIHGGYPCQPFSLAGNREGTEDDRHLWPEVFRLIQTIKPRWFVGENVAGHITLGLDSVLADLDGAGYSAEAFVIPAVSVDARHRRDRVFIVAHAHGIGDDGAGEHRIDRIREKEMQKRFESQLGFGHSSKAISNSMREGLQGSKKTGNVSVGWTERNETNSLPDAIRAEQPGQLNPMWVEWLMGFPIGWTDLNPSGTP